MKHSELKEKYQCIIKSFSLNLPLFEDFRDYCKANKKSMSAIVGMLIKKYLQDMRHEYPEPTKANRKIEKKK